MTQFDAVRPHMGAHNVDDPIITGVAIDNRVVEPGDLFVALSGERHHGISFAAGAIESGACAIWTDAHGAELAPTLNIPTEIPLAVSSHTRSDVGNIAAELMGHPSQDLSLVGITGSNGKTTTAYLTFTALEAHFGRAALRGTMGIWLGDDFFPSQRTTTEAPELQEFFALMRSRDVAAGALEVSSHALTLSRVAGTQFAAVGFTNLQRDHLDFHGDMESYFLAKCQLLSTEYSRRAVVCVDDEWGKRAAREAPMVGEAPQNLESLSTTGADATWQVVNTRAREIDGVVQPGSAFTLMGPGEEIEASVQLIGDFNVTNAAMAIVLAHRAGVPLQAAADAIAGCPGVPGRMERMFGRSPGPLAIVDYAHAPDSIAAAIRAVQPVTPGRLIVAIASDGGRDEGKRPFMGKVAAQGADVVVVTDDNPRDEDPAKIRREIIVGAREVGRAEIIEAATREEAVEICARIAGEDDTILLTGKGHETTQEIRGEMHYHDDRAQVHSELSRRWS